MSASKHTPGPWSACKNGDCSCGQIWGPDGNTSVARAYGVKELEAFEADMVPGFEMQKANTRLIAAAPDLLEALDWIVRVNDGKGSSLSVTLIDKARAAIAKATGETP